MTSKQHERDRARRHAEAQARHAAEVAERRRRRGLFALVGILVALVAVVAVVLATGGEDGDRDVAGDPTTSSGVPDPALAEGRAWDVTLETSAGRLELELDGAAAPQAVANFVTLAQDGYFDDTQCHRLTVEGIYVLQCGDPTATGTGGPGYAWGPIENAPADDVYPAGTVAMARVGGDGESMGSQFFLVYADSTIPSDAAGGYTVFGRVTGGMDVLGQVAAGGIDPDSAPRPAVEVTIERVETT